MYKEGNSISVNRIPKLSLLAALVLVAMLIGPVTSAASSQAPTKVKVLIAFTHQPGPAERALVRGVSGDIKYTYHLVPAMAASIPEVAIEGLRRNPNVTAVEPDIQAQVIDAELDNAWGVKRIGAGLIHAQGTKGTGVKVGILDTGIDLDHPDLAYDPACSVNFVEGESLDDGHSHGTHVAGTLAALDNDMGVVGVAPEATLCVYKVFSNSGSGDYSDIIAALERAVADGVQITNNSYGSSADPGTTVKAAFDNAYAAGLLHVAAAGNYGNLWGTGENCIYPARWDAVVATAATTQSDTRASFSSTCPEVELAAPGDQIYSTMPGGGYGYKSGTSMASPHLAGTAALVLAAYPDWSNGEVRSRLQSTADELGNPGRDPWYGFGLVDADEAANNPPVADDQAVTTDEDTPVGITLTASDLDGDPLAYSLVDGSTNGTLSGSAPTLTYTPDPNYNGPDSFTFIANDAVADSNIATVSITVNPVNDAPLPTFTTTCTDRTCDFDASASYDPDGSIVSYSWSFGDGNMGSGATTSHTFAAAGSYSVILTITDNGAATGTDTQRVTVNEPAPTHVGDLDGTSISNGKTWQAQVIITIHDSSHQAVVGATVSGAWSGGWSGSSSCLTGTSGTCAVTSGDMAKKVGSAILTVNNVEHAGFSYDAAGNHDPEGNSSGTAIQVNKDGSTSDPGGLDNQPPVASFSYDCPDITCSFDASGSSDPDGSIVNYAWDFGDGNTDGGVIASHTYAAPGTYSVVLSVTDGDGATDTDTQNVTVSDGPADMTLTATGYKVKGVHHADLEWSGAGSSGIDIYRDGAKIGTTANDGFYTDNMGSKGGGSYTYQVCESGTTACSNEATVTF